MWPRQFNSKWKTVERKLINDRKNFLLAYPYVLRKNSEITKKEDLYPCILKWLSEDDMIFIEMAKNFKSSNDNESLKLLLNSLDNEKIKNVLNEIEELNSLGNILKNNGIHIEYKDNKKQTRKCLLPNKVTIKDERINSPKWKNILTLDNNIQYNLTQIKNQLLIQVSCLEKLNSIKKNKNKDRNLNRKYKISFDLFIKKILQFISFLYEIQTEKYMSIQKQQQENKNKNDIENLKTDVIEKDNNQDDEDFITSLDDIF